VLRAARDAGVRRVVMTSSIAAVGYGHERLGHTLTEEDWTDVTGPNVSRT
jgi:dihydroflavonol-4-reductase